jgi:ketosteroid isomerase-like protein
LSRENVKIVRGIYAAYRRRDNQAPFEAYAPDIEWDISELGLFGVESVYHGHDGVRDCFRDVFSSFESSRSRHWSYATRVTTFLRR